MLPSTITSPSLKTARPTYRCELKHRRHLILEKGVQFIESSLCGYNGTNQSSGTETAQRNTALSSGKNLGEIIGVESTVLRQIHEQGNRLKWLRYEPVGLPIPNTRFLVFKTPLSMTLSTKIPKEKRFTTLNLLQKLGEKGIQVGLIIDLTDTDRYYERSDIERMCILYEKINCPGRGFIERDDLVDAFNATVDSFLESNVDSEIMIGVHCTNGVNRSGYLICRFLIDRLGWSSHDAIDAFERTRGYPIERGSYVQALHRAAKERRSKKRHKHTEEVISSDESEIQKMLKKRIKHKKRRKNENGSGDENCTPDMEAVLNQMAIAFEQHQSSLNSLSEASINFGMEVTTNTTEIQQQSQTSSHISAENSPFIGSTGTGEEEEDDDLSGEQDVQTMGTEPEIEISKSKKRRERRLRLQKQFELMKTGNFWKINEMQKEKFGTS